MSKAEPVLDLQQLLFAGALALDGLAAVATARRPTARDVRHPWM